MSWPEPDSVTASSATLYQATAEWLGSRWHVQVRDVVWPAGFAAQDLSEAKEATRRLIWEYTGEDCVDICLDVHLPGTIADRFYVIAQYLRDLRGELRAARTELADMRLSANDVEWLFQAMLDVPNERDGESAVGWLRELNGHTAASGLLSGWACGRPGSPL